MAWKGVKWEEVGTDSALLVQRSAQWPRLQREHDALCRWWGCRAGLRPKELQTCSGETDPGRTTRVWVAVGSACRRQVSRRSTRNLDNTTNNAENAQTQDKSEQRQLSFTYLPPCGESETPRPVNELRRQG